MSREFSIMSLASGGLAPRPPPGLRPWTPLGGLLSPRPPVPHPLYENPGSATATDFNELNAGMNLQRALSVSHKKMCHYFG